MCKSVFFLLSAVFLLNSQALPTRIYFSRCGFAGFTCVVNNSRYRVTYECPPSETDVQFYIWQFRSPAAIDGLTIRNCTTLRLSFMCTAEANRPIYDLSLVNITNLLVIKATFTHNPRSITLHNVGNLAYVPEDTFSQIKRKMPIAGCVNPAADLENIRFINVNIGFIAPKAFNDLRAFQNFSWINVHVDRVQHLAIELDLKETGNFSIQSSSIDVCEHSAFKITGREASFTGTRFVEVHAGAINGTIEKFVFNENSVNNLESYAISILSQNTTISGNKFEYLRAGAFEKISPGLLENSRRNFAFLKFFYRFLDNEVRFMDAASLNPDMKAFENVASHIIVQHNSFFCSCGNLGWLLSSFGYGSNTDLYRRFYEKVVNDEKNICAYTTCDLELKRFRDSISAKDCAKDIRPENLCHLSNFSESGVDDGLEIERNLSPSSLNSAAMCRNLGFSTLLISAIVINF